MKKVWCALKDIVIVIFVIFVVFLILVLALISGVINWIWRKCTKKDKALIPFGKWMENLFGLSEDEDPYINDHGYCEEDNDNDDL